MSIFSESRRQIANRGGRKIQKFTAHTQKSISSLYTCTPREVLAGKVGADGRTRRMRREWAAIFAGETRGVPPGPPDLTVSKLTWVGGAQSRRTENGRLFQKGTHLR